MDDNISAYKKFMKGLLAIRTDIMVARVRSGSGWPRTGIYDCFNKLYDSLNDEQRASLGNIIQETRDSAIFDTLEYFDDKICRENLQIIQNGVEYPLDFYGGDFHCDWVGLCQSNAWGVDNTCFSTIQEKELKK